MDVSTLRWFTCFVYPWQSLHCLIFPQILQLILNILILTYFFLVLVDKIYDFVLVLLTIFPKISCLARFSVFVCMYVALMEIRLFVSIQFFSLFYFFFHFFECRKRALQCFIINMFHLLLKIEETIAFFSFVCCLISFIKPWNEYMNEWMKKKIPCAYVHKFTKMKKKK